MCQNESLCTIDFKTQLRRETCFSENRISIMSYYKVERMIRKYCYETYPLVQEIILARRYQRTLKLVFIPMSSYFLWRKPHDLQTI